MTRRVAIRSDIAWAFPHAPLAGPASGELTNAPIVGT